MKKYFFITMILTIIPIMYFHISFMHNAVFAKETQKVVYDPNEYPSYSAFVYRDRVFGNSFNGLSMYIAPAKEQYEIGDDIEIRIVFKNLTDKEIRIWRISDGSRDYRYGLYFPDGSPVPKSDYGEKFEESLSKPLLKFSHRGQNIKPKDVGVHTFFIGRYFNIEKEGTYLLVMMRRTTESWEDGFLISNITKINVVKKKEEQKE